MKCIQQVSAQRKNTQPHPKRVADVTTKLLFACYSNHYAMSDAKAPLAVVAARSNQHRESNRTVNAATFPLHFTKLQRRKTIKPISKSGA